MLWRFSLPLAVLFALAACGPAPETAETNVAPTDSIQSSPVSALQDLEKLEFEAFLNESHAVLLKRRPEALTAGGVAALYGLRNDQLNDLSDSYLRETQAFEAEILALLQGYEDDSLSPTQRIWYDTYEWYLDNQIRGHPYMYHNYPVHHFVGSYQDELSRLFTELQPMETEQDAQDYVTRLSQVERQIGQVIEGLEIRKEMGVVPPSFILDMAIGQMYSYLGTRTPDPSSIDASRLEVFQVFVDKLDDIPGLSSDEKATLREEALLHVEESFVPGYVDLLNTLVGQQAEATADAGAWKLPDGDGYYRYALRTQTSTDLTPDEIHDLGLEEVDRIHAEMRDIFKELGYPEDEPLSKSIDRAIQEGGSISQNSASGQAQVLEEYELLIREAEEAVEQAFDLKPTADVIVVGDRGYSGGGYYVPGALDGSRPGAFHTGIDGGSIPKFGMPTLAYHEAVPGHHFQIGITQDIELPSFQHEVFFNAYVEGWALYAERLAAELGLYDDDPYGDLGRLHLELLRAVRLVTDTSIHAKQWTREQARVYMMEALGDSRQRWPHEVDRYIVLPGQATGYKIGMLKILEIRDKAELELGESYELRDFHRAVLENGSMPLEILEIVVEQYLDSASS
jgi:uncharacterized protein (DUF885 family)